MFVNNQTYLQLLEASKKLHKPWVPTKTSMLQQKINQIPGLVCMLVSYNKHGKLTKTTIDIKDAKSHNEVMAHIENQRKINVLFSCTQEGAINLSILRNKILKKLTRPTYVSVIFYYAECPFSNCDKSLGLFNWGVIQYNTHPKTANEYTAIIDEYFNVFLEAVNETLRDPLVAYAE